ncbi:MAG: NAD-dependent epimerase/dehydratase family protein [Ignavibacteria bacterium]|nr:NAD-dependent epimerase/dehydratase family protein [Ignavibacteria bacterium]
MQKITITGGAGFIGSHLCKYWISRNFQVTVIDNLRSGFEKNLSGLNNVTLIKESITSRAEVFKAVNGSKYVFNMAAMISVPESMTNPFECVNINVNGLINILDAAKEYGVEKVIHSSSAAIYGEDPELPKTTSMRPNPKSPYGITKLDGEYYLNMYSDFYGLKTTSLRYFNVFGPGQDPKSQYAAAIPIFVYKALNNEDITIYGDGEQTRDFVFVEDVVQANVLAAESSIPKGVYNVANGKTITIKQLAQLIIEYTNSKSKILFAPERAGDIKHSLASIDNTVAELGFSPKCNLEDGLKSTVDYFIGIMKK